MSDLDTLKKALPAFIQHFEEVLKELAFYQNREGQVDTLEENIEILKAENRALKGQLAQLQQDKEIGAVL